MKKYSNDELEKLLAATRPDVRDALFSVDSADINESIAKKYAFAQEQAANLADETGMVMLGVTHPRDYVNNLVERLGVPKEMAVKLAQEVNEQIFKPIRASLKKIHGIEDPQESGSERPVRPDAHLNDSFGQGRSGEQEVKIEQGKENDNEEVEEKKYKFDLRDTRFAPERADDVKKLEDERERMIIEEIQGQKLVRVVKNPKKDIRVDIKWDDEPPPKISYNKGEDPYKETV